MVIAKTKEGILNWILFFQFNFIVNKNLFHFFILQLSNSPRREQILSEVKWLYSEETGTFSNMKLPSLITASTAASLKGESSNSPEFGINKFGHNGFQYLVSVVSETEFQAFSMWLIQSRIINFSNHFGNLLYLKTFAIHLFHLKNEFLLDFLGRNEVYWCLKEWITDWSKGWMM